MTRLLRPELCKSILINFRNIIQDIIQRRNSAKQLGLILEVFQMEPLLLILLSQVVDCRRSDSGLFVNQSETHLSLRNLNFAHLLKRALIVHLQGWRTTLKTLLKRKYPNSC